MDEKPTPSGASDFGCTHCYHAEAQAFWADVAAALQPLATLVDESHFRVTLLACRTCGQRWVKVFAEAIDWVDSDDPQYWACLPVSADEAQRLAAAGEKLNPRQIESLGADRSHLEVYRPKGGEESIRWASGVFWIMPHD